MEKRKSLINILWDNWKNALTASATILIIIGVIAYVCDDISQLLVEQLSQLMPIITLIFFVLPSAIFILITISKSFSVRLETKRKRILRIIMTCMTFITIAIAFMVHYLAIFSSGITIIDLSITRQVAELVMIALTLILASITLGIGFSQRQAPTSNTGTDITCERNNSDTYSFIGSQWFWLIAALVVAFTIYLGFMEGVALSFAFLSIIVATSFSSKSLRTANKSLELTRDTQRPFLNVVTADSEPDVPAMLYDNNYFRITLQVKNTGNLPADEVSISCFLYTQNEIENNNPLEHAEYSPSIYFPQDTIAHTFRIKNERLVECQAAKSSLLINMKYMNKITERLHKTKRYFDYQQLSSTPNYPIHSSDDRDYWD